MIDQERSTEYCVARFPEELYDSEYSGRQLLGQTCNIAFKQLPCLFSILLQNLPLSCRVFKDFPSLDQQSTPQAPCPPPTCDHGSTEALRDDHRVLQNNVQFQEGLSLSEFMQAYGTEEMRRRASRPWSLRAGPRASVAHGVGRPRALG